LIFFSGCKDKSKKGGRFDRLFVIAVRCFRYRIPAGQYGNRERKDEVNGVSIFVSMPRYPSESLILGGTFRRQAKKQIAFCVTEI